jgi:hypothetical protein
MQENCRLRPAKPPAKVKKVCKRLQKKSKVASLFAKKKADVEEVLTNDFKAEDLRKK